MMTAIPRHHTGRPFGTQADEVTADQIRRADGDTRPAMQMEQPVDYDLPRYADLRDGGLMPREPVARWAPIAWFVMIALGVFFWAFIGGPALFWVFDMLAGWL